MKLLVFTLHFQLLSAGRVEYKMKPYCEMELPSFLYESFRNVENKEKFLLTAKYSQSCKKGFETNFPRICGYDIKDDAGGIIC